MPVGAEDCFKHLSHHAPHISYLVNESAGPSTAPAKSPVSASCQTSETYGLETTRLTQSTRTREPSQEKLVCTGGHSLGTFPDCRGGASVISQGNLLTVHKINPKSSTAGVYIDQGTQTSPEPEPAPEPASFPFSADIADLSPNVRRTQELVNLYFKNIEETKHVLFQSPSLPTLPDDVWTDILANRYVDIGRIHFAYKPIAYAISTFYQWQDAFTAYAAGVCIAFPHRKGEFQTWVNNVKMLFKLHAVIGHHRVIRAERIQRQAIFDSRTRSLDDQNSIKELNSGLLLPSFAAQEQPKAPAQDVKNELAGTSEDLNVDRQIGRTRSLGVCSKWNWGRCSFGDVCRLRHACVICQSEKHTGKDCTVPKTRKARQALSR